MTIIVTGGAGFIGSNFIFHMLDKHPDDRIVCLDKLTYAGNLSTLKSVMNKPNFRFVKMDICDRDGVYKLFEEEKPDVVAEREMHLRRSRQVPRRAQRGALRSKVARGCARASKSCWWGARKLRVGRAGRAQASPSGGAASRSVSRLWADEGKRTRGKAAEHPRTTPGRSRWRRTAEPRRCAPQLPSRRGGRRQSPCAISRECSRMIPRVRRASPRPGSRAAHAGRDGTCPFHGRARS